MDETPWYETPWYETPWCFTADSVVPRSAEVQDDDASVSFDVFGDVNSAFLIAILEAGETLHVEGIQDMMTQGLRIKEFVV